MIFFKQSVKIDKKIRIVISTITMLLIVLISTFFFFDQAIIFIPIFIFSSYFFTYFSLLEDIKKIEWLMLFMMPVIFTISWYLFYFLFPVRWLTRLPFIILYIVSFYALLRTSNIFNVGVEKSLQLYRAAFSINYLYQTIIVFFLSSFIFSLKYSPFVNGFLIFFVCFPLAVNIFWSVKLNLSLDRLSLMYSMLIGLVLIEETVCLSFFSFEPTILALIITATYYSLSGLTYAYIDERFFKETIREYLWVLGIVFFICFLTLIRW